MILFLCILLCVSFVTAEKCEDINNSVSPKFLCGNVTVPDTFLCTPGKEIGCRYSFIYQNDQWNKSVEPIIYDRKCQYNSDINFSSQCSTSNCEMNVNEAADHCFNSTVEKVCDGKKMAIKLINNTEINCLFILQSKDEVFNVSTSIIKKGKDQKCNYIRTNNDFIERLEYQCSDGDNCDKKIDISKILKICNATSFLCGDKKYIKKLESPRYCIYYWRRDEGKRFKQEPLYPNGNEVSHRIEKDATCIHIDYEQMIFVCWQDLNNPNKCKNVTTEQKKEYCGDLMEKNRKGRLLMTVGFSIFSIFFIVSIVYGSICTFRKAGKAHSNLLHEYQLEFGSNPMTTSGSKKQKKRKRKEVNGKGGKVKKVKGDPPF